jgi:hypothetical protein
MAALTRIRHGDADHSWHRSARGGLALASLLALLGCSQREAPVPGDADALTFEPVAQHPVSGKLPVLDVAVWRQSSGLDEDRLYAAAGSEGLVVHLADGAFLQRLARSAASRVAVLYAMPVDDVRADFLVAVDPLAAQLTWFEINAGSGALRRLAGKPADIGEAVGGLCTHYDPASQRHRVLVVTRSGELQDWTAVAYAGKQPNFANRIEARLERRLPLGGAGGDCAADPATGNIYVIVGERELRRVVSDWSSPAEPVARSGASFEPEGVVEAVDVVRGTDGSAILLTVDRAGRRLAALDATGQLLASLELDAAATVLGSGGELVAIVTDEGELRLGAWSRVSTALGLRAAPHRGSATRP